MKLVQPIRDAKTIKNIKDKLKERGSKYYIMFVIGLNTGLRISDILSLKVSDFMDKSHVMITEKKTGKLTRFLVNAQLKKEVDGYISDMGLHHDSFLIFSRKGENKPIQRLQAYRILNSVAGELNISEVGTHTMRKTFGYWHYKQHKDVAILQDIFNHSAPSITLKYIGITQDAKDNTLHDFFL